MNANALVKIIAVVLTVVAVLLIVLRSADRPGSTVSDSAPVLAGGEPVSEATLTALGLEGDTESDTVATLVGEVRQLKGDIKGLNTENKALRADNSELLAMERSIQTRLESSIKEVAREQASHSRQQLDNLSQRTEQRYQQLLQRFQGDKKTARDYGALGGDASGTVWVPSLDADSGQDRRLLDVLPLKQSTRDRLDATVLGQSPQQAREPIVPVYTIAKNATLVGSTALTALVGRVPFGGNITDPYSFKVIIGRDNLIANGIELPEVAYSIASGKAVGDWTLGCVRGELYSITFVFQDGTIRTVPKPGDSYEGAGASRDTAIGELSDRFGNPCVMGERITNAYEYLAQRIGIATVGAAGEAAAASQTETNTGLPGYGNSTVVTGSTSDYILGRTISDTTAEVTAWLDQRQNQQFDAVYVPPGASVAIHVIEQIEIDYDPLGRKTHFSDLAFGGRPRELD